MPTTFCSVLAKIRMGWLCYYIKVLTSASSTISSRQGSKAIRRYLADAANIECMIVEALRSREPKLGIEGAIALADFIKFTGVGSLETLEEAAEMAFHLGDKKSDAHCLKGLGEVLLAHSDIQAALSSFERGPSLLMIRSESAKLLCD
jgi:hypothetical protein